MTSFPNSSNDLAFPAAAAMLTVEVPLPAESTPALPPDAGPWSDLAIARGSLQELYDVQMQLVSMGVLDAAGTLTHIVQLVSDAKPDRTTFRKAVTMAARIMQDPDRHGRRLAADWAAVSGGTHSAKCGSHRWIYSVARRPAKNVHPVRFIGFRARDIAYGARHDFAKRKGMV